MEQVTGKQTGDLSICILEKSKYPVAIDLHRSKGTQKIGLEGLLWQYHSTHLPIEGVIVAAFDGERMIGTQAFIPVEVVIKGQRALSAKSEYTLVDPDYRGMKVFERMYELGLTWAREAGVECIWGFTGATRAFERVGFGIGPELYEEKILYRPFNYFWSKTLPKVRQVEPPNSMEDSRDGEFRVKRSKSFLAYRYRDNPFRRVSFYDDKNGVLYSQGAEGSRRIWVSEVTNTSLLKASITKMRKLLKKELVMLVRISNEPRLDWRFAFPFPYKKVLTDNRLVFLWVNDRQRNWVPSISVEEGMSQGVS